MIVTVNLIDGVWWFDLDQDALPGKIQHLQRTHLIRVPDGTQWIDLVDCLRPEVPLHALRIPLPGRADRSLDAGAANLVFIAEAEILEGVAIATKIV